jgi:TP901 family phage tail tape measure protein
MAIPIAATLSVTTAGFKTAMRGAGKVLGGFVAITKMATVAVIGLTAAFTAIVARQAAVIDRLGKVSKVTGVAADTLQKFQFAAELAGVSSDQAAVALRRFSRRLGEAQKNTGELAPTLRRLGIDLKDSNGQFKTAEQVLFELSDGIKATEGESAKLAIAFKAFDSEGAELVNTLSEGGDALQDVFNRADALGFVLSTSAIQGVEDFNDSFKELTTLLGGVTNQLVAALAPALQDLTIRLTDFLLELGDKFGGVENLGEALAVALLESISSIISSFASLEAAVIQFFNNFRFYARGFGFGDLTPDAQAFQDVLTLLNDELDKIGGGKPVDRFSQKLATTIAAMDALKRITAQVGDTLPGLMPEQLLEFENNLTSIISTYNDLVASGETNAFRQNQALQGVNELLNDNIELLRQGLEQQTFSNDQIDFNYEKYRLILAELERMKFIIIGNKDKEEETTEELEKQLTFREKIIAALERSKEILDTVLERVRERLGTPLERLTKTLEDGLVKGVEMFEDSLTDAIMTGKADFTALGEHIKRVLAKALVQRFITGPILSIFGLAKGGPAKAGQPYIVGEKGPELFVPGASGTVIPNHQLSQGGGAAASVTYNINAVDTQSFQQALARDPEFLFAVTEKGARSIPRGR